MSITTRAAVCRVPGQPWEITELELDEPRANEIRVKFEALAEGARRATASLW